VCRWLAYAGDPIPIEWLTVKASHSLIDQSLHARLGATTTNGDGFGVGWYDNGSGPGLYRSTHPAWNDRNLRELAAHISSRLFFAHVRASTGSAVQESNCHPFRYGRWLFMHNGLVRQFPRLRRELSIAVDPSLIGAAEGSTDSELLFHLALTFGAQDDPRGGLERMAGYVEEVALRYGVRTPLQLAAALTDGTSIVAVRYSSARVSRSLFYGVNANAIKQQCPTDERVQGMAHESLTIVSEPLGGLADAWTEVPEGHAVEMWPGTAELAPFTPRP
jgi:predicted glutamine amidotransferase